MNNIIPKETPDQFVEVAAEKVLEIIREAKEMGINSIQISPIHEKVLIALKAKGYDLHLEKDPVLRRDKVVYFVFPTSE